jgi:hypothetical protein
MNMAFYERRSWKMTNRRAMELLMIEMACVRRGSGMEYGIEVSEDGCEMKQGWIKVHDDCDRDCAHCELVQDSEELLEMYNKVILMMIDKVNEEEQSKSKLKDWQLRCDPRLGLTV